MRYAYTHKLKKKDLEELNIKENINISKKLDSEL